MSEIDQFYLETGWDGNTYLFHSRPDSPLSTVHEGDFVRKEDHDQLIEELEQELDRMRELLLQYIGQVTLQTLGVRDEKGNWIHNQEVAQ